MLSGTDCRITRGSGTLDKRIGSVCSRNCGRSRDRRAGSGGRKLGLDGDDASHYTDDDDHTDPDVQRQKILDPEYSSDASIVFKNHYKIKPKQKYNNEKIMNTIQIMLRNIHPNPEKRMTPQETKRFFVSIFYEC